MSTVSIRSTRVIVPNVDQPTSVETSYLEVIYYLATRREPVIAAQLARWMRVRPPTVTNIVQRLEQKGLITRDATAAISLTPSGYIWAEQIVRRHRLLERFLYDTLKIPWHEVHREATLLAPAISSALEARVALLIGDARTCPHGNPIPGQGAPLYDDSRLCDAPTGACYVITRIDEEAGEDSCILQLLWIRGLLPGTTVVRLPDPRDGIAMRRSTRRIVLSRHVAKLIWGVPTPM